MKKLFLFIVAIFTCLISQAYTKESKGGDYVYFTDVTGWDSSTDSDTYSIYYKEGNGERIYALKSGYYYYDIHDNHYYNSQVCKDFRKNYQYVSNDTYFNCNLPGRKKELINGYSFYQQVEAWSTAFDSDIYSVMYKEGNGERIYQIKIGYYYYDIHDNNYYKSEVCDDFRKNYRYVADGNYFNCDLIGREKEIVNGYNFYKQVKSWSTAFDSDINSVFYKEGNGKRIYYLKSGYYYYEIKRNDYYNNPSCNDFRKNYKYVANDEYFDL